MKEKENINQTEQCSVNIGDAIFVINPMKIKVTEYRVTYLHNGMVEAVSGVSDDIFYPISTIGQLFFMSRVEAKEYLRNNRQSILDGYRKIFEKTGDWSKLAELGNILAEEKEKSPSGRGEYSAEDVESAINCLESISRCLRSDRSVDDFITSWERNNPEVPNLREEIKEMYAENIDFSINLLKSIL